MADSANGADIVDVEEHDEDGSRTESKLDFATRLGSFMLLNPSIETGPLLHDALCAALNEDPRVSSVEPIAPAPPAERRNSWPRFRIDRVETDASFTLAGSQIKPGTANQFMPIAFSVSVPAKNQRVVADGPVPSEEYHALWDGLTLLVSWPNPGGGHVYTASGGHVVGEVLADAARACGGDLFVQACTPGCEYGFNHTTLLVSVNRESGAGSEYASLCGGRQLHVHAPSVDDGDTVEAHALGLFGTLERPYREFALMKNRSTHALLLSMRAGKRAEELLALLKERASADVGTRKERLAQRWNLRRWRRNARLLIAELWLQIAELESIRRDWHTLRTEFETAASDPDVLDLFASDYQTEASDLDRLELASLRAQVEHASARLDNRDVVAATSVGALAGGLAGALVNIVV